MGYLAYVRKDLERLMLLINELRDCRHIIQAGNSGPQVYEYDGRNEGARYLSVSLKRPNSPRHSEVASAIVSILKQQEADIPAKEICRQHGIFEAIFYNWKSRYGGMEASYVRRLKDLEAAATRNKIHA